MLRDWRSIKPHFRDVHHCADMLVMQATICAHSLFNQTNLFTN